MTKSSIERVEVATFIRRMKIKKKDKVKYRVGNETNNNNKPAAVDNSVRERKNNNNQPAPVNNPVNNKK
ncbi:MAG: hypothetical protein AAF063_31450 [Cyanobacteria bacterium J06643_5]